MLGVDGIIAHLGETDVIAVNRNTDVICGGNA